MTDGGNTDDRGAFDGLNARLAEDLGIDLRRAARDPELRQLVAEMTSGCAQCRNSGTCARSVLQEEKRADPPEFCPHRHVLQLLQRKSPFGQPMSRDDPFAQGRSRAAPVTRFDDPRLNSGDL